MSAGVDVVELGSDLSDHRIKVRLDLGDVTGTTAPVESGITAALDDPAIAGFLAAHEGEDLLSSIEASEDGWNLELHAASAILTASIDADSLTVSTPEVEAIPAPLTAGGG